MLIHVTSAFYIAPPSLADGGRKNDIKNVDKRELHSVKNVNKGKHKMIGKITYKNAKANKQKRSKKVNELTLNFRHIKTGRVLGVLKERKTN